MPKKSRSHRFSPLNHDIGRERRYTSINKIHLQHRTDSWFSIPNQSHVWSCNCYNKSRLLVTIKYLISGSSAFFAINKLTLEWLVNICMKFHEDILNGFKVIERTRCHRNCYVQSSKGHNPNNIYPRVKVLLLCTSSNVS